MKKKILLIELNEFSIDLLNKGVKVLGLKNIKKILKLNHSKTFSDDQLEGQGLDPWVQWVSVHTGKPSKVHNVLRIGDIPKLELPQVWEILASNGITTGIWGPMNASLNNRRGCKFFLPDPWAYSEIGYPDSLNSFLDLPRYYSKNYIVPSKKNLAKGFLKFILFFLRKGIFLSFLKESINASLIILKNGLSNMTLFSLFDMFNTIAFLKFKNSTSPDFSIIFLNSLAHLQHHYWSDKETNKEMKMCLRILDKIIGLLLDSLKPNESVVVVNALSQRNVFKKGIYIYRQIDSREFLNAANIKYAKFEEGMTNDCHIFFSSIDDLNHAYIVFANAKIKNKKIFYVEIDTKFKNKLFVQLNFHKKVSLNQYLSINNRSLKFFDYFTLIRERTGEHIKEGDIFSQRVLFPEKLKNHHISNYLFNHFDIKI